MLKERKLNIAPAIKKQVSRLSDMRCCMFCQQTYCGRSYEMGQPVLNGGYYYSPSGTPYTYQVGWLSADRVVKRCTIFVSFILNLW